MLHLSRRSHRLHHLLQNCLQMLDSSAMCALACIHWVTERVDNGGKGRGFRKGAAPQKLCVCKFVVLSFCLRTCAPESALGQLQTPCPDQAKNQCSMQLMSKESTHGANAQEASLPLAENGLYGSHIDLQRSRFPLSNAIQGRSVGPLTFIHDVTESYRQHVFQH